MVRLVNLKIIRLIASLKGCEIVALTGASSPFDELCDKACISEAERGVYFKKLIDLGQYPEALKYTSREGTQLVIQVVLSRLSIDYHHSI